MSNINHLKQKENKFRMKKGNVDEETIELSLLVLYMFLYITVTRADPTKNKNKMKNKLQKQQLEPFRSYLQSPQSICYYKKYQE